MIVSIRWIIFLSFFSILVGLLTFLRGFMPNKVGLPGFATTTTKQAFHSFGNGKVLSHQRLVIVLIDALRADFVLGKTKYMKYTRSLIELHETVPLLVKANAPTVTLPRIKAITTGGIPGFVDVVLNFDSKALNEDNLLSQFRRADKKIVFFGDDTWLRLFPDTFHRTDGTTSFFVSDYTEVDRNVSRHLKHELEERDWDVMILHYLGLDHIGHLAGPSSPLVAPKLHEMDQVVEMIHKQLLKLSEERGEDSLMLLCGDHGMTDQGGHGGASYSEVTTPAVFISTKFQHGQGIAFDEDLTVNQFDVTPTLALLFGLPIPLNSFGMLISQVFRDSSLSELVTLHQENAEQLWKVVDWTMKGAITEYMHEEFESARLSLDAWRTSPHDPASREWKRQGKSVLKKYQGVMRKMQEKVTTSLTDYDLHALVVGIIILWLVLITTVLHLNSPGCEHLTVNSGGLTGILSIAALLAPLMLHAIACTSSWGGRWLCASDPVPRMVQGLIVLIMSLFLFLIFHRLYGILVHDSRVKNSNAERASLCDWVLVVGTVLHSLSLLSSSFIEEEHQTWYFFTTTFHIMAGLQVASQHAKQNMTRASSVDESPEKYTLLKERSGCTGSMARMRTGAFGSVLSPQNSERLRDADVSNIQLSKNPLLFANARERENLNDMSSAGKQKPEQCSNHAGYLSRLLSPDFRVNVWIGVIAVLGRFARTLNQTGNKWLDQPDVGDWLVRSEQNLVLSLLVVVAMTVIFATRLSLHGAFSRLIFALGLVGVYAFRAANGLLWIPGILTPMLSEKGVVEAWWVFSTSALIITESLYNYITSTRAVQNKAEHLSEKFLTSWILFIALLFRPHNVLLVAVLTVQERLVYRCLVKHLDLSLPSLTLYYLWMGQAAFFYQGNSNSVSTVDVSAGYVGLTEYRPFFIGTFMLLSTYSGPIFWFIGLTKAAQLKRHRRTAVSHTLLLSRVLPLALFTVLLFCQRYHLFVWTVFSPKLLYEGTFSVIVAVFSLALISLS